VSAPVYSTRFIAGLATPTVPLTATVPAGYRWVVRYITALPSGTGLTQAAVSLGSVTFLWSVASISTNNSAQQDLHQVLNAGDELECGVQGASAYFMVSGYQLTLP
jgi:hypothetical protein